MWRRLWPLGLTKFLTNFNDNCFKAVTTYLAVSLEPDPGKQAAIIAIAAMLFMLPYAGLPTAAGWLADRYDKRRVLIFTKVLELGIMLVGAGCYLLLPQFGLWPLMLVLLLLAGQSALLFPAYTGLLPETFDERELSRANGILELIAYLGIILGSGCGVLVQLARQESLTHLLHLDPIRLLGVPSVVIAGLGLAVSLFVHGTHSPVSKEPFGVQIITGYFRSFRHLAPTRPVLLCILSNGLFMAFGGLILWTLVAFGKELRLDETRTTFLQLAAALGIGAGCFIAGQCSGERVEFGLVPIGALGVAAFTLNLALAPGFGQALVACIGVGFYGGFFGLPPQVYIQEMTPEAVRGKTLAAANAFWFWCLFFTFGAMLVLTGGTTAAGADLWTRCRHHFLTLDMRQLYFGAAALFAVIALVTLWLLPEHLARLLVQIATRLVYSVSVHGREHLPRHGPALLIANHVSVVDGLLITAATRRVIYFVVDQSYVNSPWLRPLGRWSRMIALPPPDQPKALQQALLTAQDVLRRGDLLCVFPEGKLTGNGMIHEFKKGFLRMVPPEGEVPIIPVHLGLVWGSIFSRRFREIKLRRPRRFPYPVMVAFGRPLPKDVTPAQARLAVGELAAEAELPAQPNEPTLPELFMRQSRWRPFKKLYQDSTGQELRGFSALVRALVLAGAFRRDRRGADEEYVGLLLPNSTTGVVAALAVMLNDQIPVFLNYTAAPDAIDYAIATCQLRRIYTARAFIDKLNYPSRPELVYLEDLARGLTTTQRLRGLLAALFMPVWLARRHYFPQTAASVHRPATVLFSSGSTGRPKGAVLTHHNFTTNLNATLRVIGLETDDVILGILPFFHSFGFMATLCLPMYWGVRVVFHPNPLDAARVGELVAAEHATVLFTAPSFLQAYTRKCEPAQLRSLRLIVTGAEKLRPSVAEGYFAKFGTLPIEGYGTTELSPVVSVNMPESFHDLGQKTGRPGSIGQPIPGVCAKIVDPATHQEVGEGAEGVLWIKGPNVMKEYLKEPAKTAAVLHDGWYDTGDVGRMDADGYLYITGRLTRFSKIAGEMVPHLRIEEEIQTVLGSVETLVIVTGVEDDLRGERLVVLHLALPKPVPEIIAALRARGLPNLWIPKPRDFLLVPRIPLLGSGKLDLAGVQALARQRARADDLRSEI